MDCDNVIYHTDDADADRDGPGSNQGRTHLDHAYSIRTPFYMHVGV